jgi:hypothetical protein
VVISQGEIRWTDTERVGKLALRKLELVLSGVETVLGR